MKTVFITGATGMMGSVICAHLLKQGDKVRTIARTPDGADAKALQAAGVEVLPGDVTDLASIKAGMKGADGVIHSAAMLGRPGITYAGAFDVNVTGTINVYTAAAMAGGTPVVQVLTTTFFDMWDKPLTELSPLDVLFQNVDPYTVTKRIGYTEGVTRALEGQDIRFMIPGAVFGPAICMTKAMERLSFNDRIRSAIAGEMGPQVPIPMPFVLADDCAYVCIAALEKGKKGARYIAHGRSGEIGTLAATCNRACAIAGVSHRIEEVPKDRLDDPDLIERLGPTIPLLAKRNYPKPFSESPLTQQKLGYKPTPLDEGLKVTIDWMREHKII